LRDTVRNVEAKQIEMDEICDFIAMKDRTKKKLVRVGDDIGDSWTWLAIDVESKLILSHAVGLRDEAACERFVTPLQSAGSDARSPIHAIDQCPQQDLPAPFGHDGTVRGLAQFRPAEHGLGQGHHAGDGGGTHGRAIGSGYAFAAGGVICPQRDRHCLAATAQRKIAFRWRLATRCGGASDGI
jgi:hypothetical protein